jgi:hypothetical protein
MAGLSLGHLIDGGHDDSAGWIGGSRVCRGELQVMTETPHRADREPLAESSRENREVETTISTTYKVLGRHDAPDGEGDKGHSEATNE